MSSPRKKLILLPDRVLATIEKLRDRIHERFGERGLYRVCGQLLEIAKIDMLDVRSIGRRYIWLRLLITLILAAAAAMLWRVAPLFKGVTTPATEISSVLQGIEAAANLTLLTGAVVIFLVRLEVRFKRRRALEVPARASLHRPRHRHASAHEGSEQVHRRIDHAVVAARRTQ